MRCINSSSLTGSEATLFAWAVGMACMDERGLRIPVQGLIPVGSILPWSQGQRYRAESGFGLGPVRPTPRPGETLIRHSETLANSRRSCHKRFPRLPGQWTDRKTRRNAGQGRPAGQFFPCPRHPNQPSPRRSACYWSMTTQSCVKGLANVLNAQPYLSVCGEAQGRADALVAARAGCGPDLALVDLSLSGGDGLELIKDLRVRLPGVAHPGPLDARRDDLRRTRVAGRGARVRDEAGKIRPTAAGPSAGCWRGRST